MRFIWGVGLKGNSVDSKYKKQARSYEKHSIGTELDAWGPLVKIGDNYFCWTGKSS